MVINFSVLFKIPLISAGSGDHLIVQFQNGEVVACSFLRVADTDAKRRTVWLLSKSGYISPQGENSSGNPAVLVQFQHLLDGVTLDSSAEVELHVWTGQVNCAVFFVNGHFLVMNESLCFGDFLIRGNLGTVACDVPKLD